MQKKRESVLITAGTQRLGFHVARACLEMGYSVILHYRSTDRVARHWLKNNPHHSENVFFMQQDLRFNPEALIEKAKKIPCILVGLVNNASLFTPGNLSDHLHLRQMLDIHLNIPALLGCRFAEYVRHGWIVNIGDALIHTPNATYQNYRMSKLFLEELTRQQAFLYAPGIRVNAIAPGIILPSRTQKGKNIDDLVAVKKRVLLPQTHTIKAFIDTLRFLIGNTYCTGQIVTVDGGWNCTV